MRNKSEENTLREGWEGRRCVPGRRAAAAEEGILNFSKKEETRRRNDSHGARCCFARDLETEANNFRRKCCEEGSQDMRG